MTSTLEADPKASRALDAGVRVRFSNGYRLFSFDADAWRQVVNAAASTLAGFGVGENGALALHADNSPAWVAAWTAATEMGATVVLPAPTTDTEGLRALAQRHGAALTVSDHAEKDDEASCSADAFWREIQCRLAANAAATAPEQNGAGRVVVYDEHGFGAAFDVDALLACADAARPELRLDADGGVLSLLPYSSLPAQTLGLMAARRAGAEIAVAPAASPADWFRCATMTQPTHVLLSAAQLDYLHRRIWTRARQQARESALKLALDKGQKKGEAFRKMVFRSLYAQLGGRVQAFVCLGAPSKEVVEFFAAIDLPVQACFGSPDTAPLLTLGSRNAFTVDSVGTLLPPHTVRVQADGRLHVGGAATGSPVDPQRATPDGFVVSEQFGEQDADGELFLRDAEKKEPEDTDVLARTLREFGLPQEADPARGLAELGLDSLRRLDLLLALERRSGGELPEALLHGDSTINDLRAALEKIPDSPTAFHPLWTLTAPARWAREAAYHLVIRPLIARYAPAKVIGLERIEGLREPALFAANHLSHADTPVLFTALPARLRRRIAGAAWKEYYFNKNHSLKRKLYGRFIFLVSCITCNAFPFSQIGEYRSSFRHMGQLMNRGWNVLYYPAGERSTDGDVGKPRPGFERARHLLQAPVVPVYLDGLEKVLPKDGSWPKRSACTVAFGEPILPHELAPDALNAAVRAAWLRLREETARADAETA